VDRDAASSRSASTLSDSSPPTTTTDAAARASRRRSRSQTPSERRPNVPRPDLQKVRRVADFVTSHLIKPMVNRFKVRGQDVPPQVPPPPPPAGPKPGLPSVPAPPAPQNSNSERSLPRSLPFYEVPAPRIAYISGRNENPNYTPYQNTELFNRINPPPPRNSTFGQYGKDYSRPDKSRLI
jgi:hypothetical protein